MARPTTPVSRVLRIEGSVTSEPVETTQVVGEVPGEVAGTADVPEGEQAADFAGVLCEYAQRIGGEHGERRGHDGVEQAVYGLVVGEFGAVRCRNQVQLGVGGQQGQREVVVDVCVHARERKLDAIDAGAVACLKQCAPCRGHGVSTEETGDGGEVEAGEDDIEAGEPDWALPRATGRVQIDLLGHHEIEPVEPLEAVVHRQQCVDGLHARDHVRDRHRSRAVDEVVERLVGNGRGGCGHARSPKAVCRSISDPLHPLAAHGATSEPSRDKSLS